MSFFLFVLLDFVHGRNWFWKMHLPPHQLPDFQVGHSPDPSSPLLSFIMASSFHCRDKGAWCIVGRLSFKVGSPPLCVLWERWFYVTHEDPHTHPRTPTHTHTQTFQKTLPLYNFCTYSAVLTFLWSSMRCFSNYFCVNKSLNLW